MDRGNELHRAHIQLRPSSNSIFLSDWLLPGPGIFSLSMFLTDVAHARATTPAGQLVGHLSSHGAVYREPGSVLKSMSRED